MEPNLANGNNGNPPVTVYLGEDGAQSQPRNFRVCPLGIQLYAQHCIPEYEMIECRFSIPGNNGASEELCCSGIVVNCRPDQETSLFRVWIKFLDLPDNDRNRIHCLAKADSFLCPHCENF